MKAATVVHILLDDLPGVDQQTLDQIMDLILGVVDRVKSGNPQVDRPRFEQEVNPLLEPWGILFTSNDADLRRYNVPGKAGLEGVIMGTPKRINRDEFAYIREILSHELVHGDQISRAMTSGNALKMFQSAHNRMMPGGMMDYEKYHTDPHEVTAYARSTIDKMRRLKIPRERAMQMLRHEPVTQHQRGTKSHKRFLKHAAGYAQQLPEA